MAWTDLTYSFGSVLTSTQMTQNQDNFTALAQGLSGAPKILSAALDSGVGQALTLLSTASASTSSAIDFTLDIATYKNFKVIIRAYAPSTTSTNLLLRYSTNGGSTFKSASGDYASSLSVVTTSIELTPYGSLSTGAGYFAYFELDFFDMNASGTTRHPVMWRYGINQNAVTLNKYDTDLIGTSKANMSASVDAIRFLSSSGNIDNGIFYLYGIQDA